MKKDYLGNELNVNDKVVFKVPRYHNLAKGRISTLTNKKARVIYKTML